MSGRPTATSGGSAVADGPAGVGIASRKGMIAGAGALIHAGRAGSGPRGTDPRRPAWKGPAGVPGGDQPRGGLDHGGPPDAGGSSGRPIPAHNRREDPGSTRLVSPVAPPGRRRQSGQPASIRDAQRSAGGTFATSWHFDPPHLRRRSPPQRHDRLRDEGASQSPHHTKCHTEGVALPARVRPLAPRSCTVAGRGRAHHVPRHSNGAQADLITASGSASPRGRRGS